MKEILEKLTKRTEESNAHLEVNAALAKERNASLRVQSHIAKQQDEKLRSLVNITKAGLLGDEREKSVARLQEDLKETRESRKDAYQKETDEKSFDLRAKAKALQEESIRISSSSLAILRFNVIRDFRKGLAAKKAAKIATNRAKLLAQSILDIRDTLKRDGKTNVELLKAYKDPSEKGLLRKSAEGIASLVKITKDGETRSPTLKLIKYFRDRDKRAAIRDKERQQEALKAVNNKDLIANMRFGKAPKKGFANSAKMFFGRLNAWTVAIGNLIAKAAVFIGPKILTLLRFAAKRFFVIGVVISAIMGIKDAIAAFAKTEGGMVEKVTAALGEFSRTFLATFLGGMIEGIKFIGLKIAELFGADPNGPMMTAFRNWNAIDAVKELFDGIVNSLKELVVGLVGEITDGASMFGPDSNWFQSAIGVLLGAGKGLLIGLVDGIAELLGSFLMFDPTADSDLGQSLKDFSMKDWLEGTVRPFILGIPDAIAKFLRWCYR